MKSLNRMLGLSLALLMILTVCPALRPAAEDQPPVHLYIYDGEPGNSNLIETREVAYGEAGGAVEDPIPPQEGLYFYAWVYPVNGGEEYCVYDPEAPLTEDLCLGAWFDWIEFCVNVYIYDQETVDEWYWIWYGDPGIELTEPSRQGYEFTGWYTDPDLTKPYDPAAPILEETTIYAGWAELLPFVITEQPREVVTIDESVSLTVTASGGRAPYRYGWEFSTDGENWTICGAEWSADPAIDLPSGDGRRYRCFVQDAAGEYIVSDEITITRVAPVHLTLLDGGAGEPLVLPLLPGAPGGVLTAPVREGLVFGGWYYDPDFHLPYDPAAPVLNDLSVYAKWIVRDDSADLNGDDTSSILDVTALLRYLSTGDPQVVVLERVDVNGDGTCSILDVTALLSYLGG